MKTRVNRVLGAVSGHHLAKGRPGEERTRAAADLGSANRRIKQLQQQVGDLKRAEQRRVTERAEDRAANLALPGDLDPASREIIFGVYTNTDADYESLYALISAVRHVETREIGGAIVDCGAGRGGSVQAAARTLVDLDDKSRELYAVYSFGAKSTEADEIAVSISSTGYPDDLVHYLAGDIRNTVWAKLPDVISVLRVDVTDYRVADHELHQLWDRIVPGGVLLIDGFDRGTDAQAALDDLVARTPENIFFVRAGTARVAVKTLS